MRTVTKTTRIKKPAAKPAKKVVARSALRGTVLTQEELHESMVAYGKKVSATRQRALAFLKSIGAPVKTIGR